MEKGKLNEKLKELNDIIRILNSSRHNKSLELESCARDLFETIIDEIQN